MLEMLFYFESFFSSFFGALIFGFYCSIRFFFYFLEMGFVGNYWVFLITQVFLTIITTRIAKEKEYNVLLTLLMCLVLPLLGSLIVIALLPNKKETAESKYYISKRIDEISKNISSVDTGINKVETSIVNIGDTWTCKKCGYENRISFSSCKSCGEYK